MYINGLVGSDDHQNGIRHPELPLILTRGIIYDLNGKIAGYCADLEDGKEHLYVLFYESKLVVTERNRFESNCTRAVAEEITNNYLYAFRIICDDGITAVIDWENDVVLVGISGGHLENGQFLWTPAKNINPWPGLIRE